MSHREGDLKLVTVASGSLLELEILQGALGEAGIPSTIPDTAIKLVQPFLTGASALDCRLEVPGAFRERALERIEELKLHGEEELREHFAREGFEEEPSGLPDEEAERLAELEVLGRRVCWAIVILVTQPFAIPHIRAYFKGLESVSRKPRGHIFVIVAIVYMALFWGALVPILLLER